MGMEASPGDELDKQHADDHTGQWTAGWHGLVVTFVEYWYRTFRY